MKENKQDAERDGQPKESIHSELRDIWLKFCARTDDLKKEVMRFESAIRDSK